MVSLWNADILHMYDPDESGKASSYFAQYGHVFSSFAPERVQWLNNTVFAPGTKKGLYFQFDVVGNKTGAFNLPVGSPPTGAQPLRNQYAHRVGDPEALRDGLPLDGFTPNRGWFLTAADGVSYVFADNGDTVKLNTNNPQLRQWILFRILEMMNIYPIFDYVWFDNRNLYKGNHTGGLVTSLEFGAGDSQIAIDAHIEFGQWLDKELNARGILTGGNVQGVFGDNFRRMTKNMDVVFIEYWGLNSSGNYDSVAEVTDDFNKALWLATNGKYVAVRGTIDYDLLEANNSAALTRQNYFMALCNMVAGTRFALKVDDEYDRAFIHPDIEDWNKLGHPTSNPVLQGNGQWYREFGNGTLTINPATNSYVRTLANPTYDPTMRYPFISPIVNLKRTFFDEAQFRVYAKSTDGATLEYQLGNPAPGWSIDPDTGIVTGKLQPSAVDLFFYNMGVTVTATLGEETRDSFANFTLEGKPGVFHDGFSSGSNAITFEDGVIGADRAAGSVYRVSQSGTFGETTTASTHYGEYYSWIPDLIGNSYLFLSLGNAAWQIDVSALSGKAYVLFILRTGGSASNITIAMPQVGVSFQGDFYSESGAGANKNKLIGYTVDVSEIDLLDITLTNTSGTSRFSGVLIYEYLEADPNPVITPNKKIVPLLLLRRLI